MVTQNLGYRYITLQSPETPIDLPTNKGPTARQVFAKDFLVSDDTWEDLCNTGDVDFIVIGSGVRPIR
jgi:hypothetical protein